MGRVVVYVLTVREFSALQMRRVNNGREDHGGQ